MKIDKERKTNRSKIPNKTASTIKKHSTDNIVVNGLQSNRPTSSLALPNQYYATALDFNKEDTSENIKVCLRIRPLMKHEKDRNTNVCLEYVNKSQVRFTHGKLNKTYSFNQVFDTNATQDELFNVCSIDNLVQSVLDGYSVTIFAYGQTGSGKTFTIMGPDESIDNNLIQNDLTGLIPKSVKHIWKSVQSINSKVFIKVSYCEIYNELINDLLSPGTKSLPIRWNPNQGFFVEGLLLIDCRTPQDVVDVLLEGHKNRKVGSHCLNPDSSRSHSLFTMYIIIEELVSGKPFRKYGKITFVDLAGSERLKESGSTGDQVKETGNINRSLFVLGKVISCLSDTKKSGNQHVPYRDSKLTMLLMDSIGGSSKTLMIACVSPSDEWSDETLSTLNYASKSMNIKNIPTVKITSEEETVFKLTKENKFLKAENEFIKNELIKLTGTYPVMDPNNPNQLEELTLKDGESLPPINSSIKNNHFKFPELEENLDNSLDENKVLKREKDILDKQSYNLIEENKVLSSKLTNLENVFIGPSKISELNRSIIGQGELNISKLTNDNLNLRKVLQKTEFEKAELREKASKVENPGMVIKAEDEELAQLTEQNAKLNRRVEFLQKRERELLQTLMQLKYKN